MQLYVNFLLKISHQEKNLKFSKEKNKKKIYTKG